MNARESHSPESGGGGAEDEHRVIQQIKVVRKAGRQTGRWQNQAKGKGGEDVQV